MAAAASSLLYSSLFDSVMGLKEIKKRMGDRVCRIHRESMPNGPLQGNGSHSMGCGLSTKKDNR